MTGLVSRMPTAEQAAQTLSTGGDFSKGLGERLTPLKGVPEHIGAGVEEATEWMAGGAVLDSLKELSGLNKALQAGKVSLKNYPAALKLLTRLAKIGEQATVGAGVGAAHGSAAGDTAGEAGRGALYGAAGEVVSQTAEKVGSKLWEKAVDSVKSKLDLAPKDLLYGQKPAEQIMHQGISTHGTTKEFAARIDQRVNDLVGEAKNLTKNLDASAPWGIPVKTVVDNTVDAGVAKIMKSQMSIAEKNEAKQVLEGIRDSLTYQTNINPKTGMFVKGRKLPHALRGTASFSEAVELKQSVGNQINWTMRDKPYADVIRDTEKKLYGGLKDAINLEAMNHPNLGGHELAGLNEQISDLLSASRGLKEKTLKEAAKPQSWFKVKDALMGIPGVIFWVAGHPYAGSAIAAAPHVGRAIMRSSAGAPIGRVGAAAAEAAASKAGRAAVGATVKSTVKAVTGDDDTTEEIKHHVYDEANKLIGRQTDRQKELGVMTPHEDA